MITNNGLSMAIELLASGGGDRLSHFALGSLNSALSFDLTGLTSELGTRTALAFTVSTTGSIATVEASTEYNSMQGIGAFSSIGGFSQATNGSCFNLAKFNEISHENGTGSELKILYSFNVE